MRIQAGRKQRGGLVLSALVALSLASLGAASGAFAGQAAPSSEPSAKPSDSGRPATPGEQMAARWGVQPHEAEARIALDPPAQRFNDDLTRELPEVFAGTWWGPDASKVLNIGVTRGSANRVNAYLSRLPDEVEAVVHELAFGQRELVEATRRVAGVGPWRTANGSGLDFGVGTAADSNGLVVDYAGGDAAFEAAVKAAAAPVEVRFDPAGAPQPTSCLNRFNCSENPMRGGLEFTPAGCTTGFIATHNATGFRGAITAGHCTSVNDDINHGGADLGRVTHQSSTTADVSFIKFEEPFRTGARNIIYRSGADPQWAITQSSGSTNYTLGQTQCHVGAGSFSEQCGGVSRNWYSYYDGGHLYEALYRFDACVVGGDSGGPTYTLGRTAAGITHGGWPISGSCPNSNSRTLSTYMHSANQSVNTTTLTS